MMDFGVTGKLRGYYLAEQYRRTAAAGVGGGVGFAELAAAKAAGKVTGQENVSGMSFREMWQTRFPGAYYHTMDACKIPQGTWGRLDFPHEKFFSDNVDESIMNWKPTGPEPKMTDASVQSRADVYTEYLRSKYSNVRIQSVGKDQQSLDRAGKSMSGSDVVIAPNILEQMANDPEKAAYYEGKIDDFFNATPRLKAQFAAQGLDYQPCGVVVHEDGSVTYIGGCADSPERVAEVNAINKAKREKEAAQRKASLERSQEAADILK